MKRPILIALMGYIIGIIWELYFRINIAPIIFVLIIAIILDKKHRKMFILIIIAMLISNIQTNTLNTKFDKLYTNISTESKIFGTIISEKNEGDYYNTYTIKIISIEGNNKYKNTKLLLKTNAFLDYGDTILFTANYKPAKGQRNYLEFDYSRYLKTMKIYGMFENVRIEKVLKRNDLNKVNLFFHKITVEFKEKISFILKENERDLLIALITGDNTVINDEIKDDFRNSGLYHILAISGMHMAYIVVILEKMTDFINISKGKKKLIQILGIIFFMNITTQSASIIRASIMAILSISAFIFKRKSDTINNLCIAMLLILITNPYSIENISFQLSFGGIIGIILLNKYYKNFLVKLILKDNILESISGILSAQTIIIPIMILNFHTISLTFLISNLLAGYVIGGIIVLGFVTTCSSFISLNLAIVISKPLKILINLLILITKLGSLLPFSKIYIVRPPIYLIIIYYALILKFSLYKKLWNEEIRMIIRFIMNKKIYIMIIIIIFINIIIPKNLNIHFIDVGQGDATLIITPQNKKILIDSGGSENYDIGKNTLLPYLLNRGIRKIDYAIISHFDTDHVGGLLTVMEELKVEHVIISKQEENSENFPQFIKIAKDKKIKIIIVEAGAPDSPIKISIEKDLYVDFLWPNNENLISENVLNNNSIVCKLHYKNFSILFTGDIEEVAERKILQEYKNNLNILDSTILKIAHHGSKTSSTKEFIEVVNPKIALIGVGENNKYGHPSDKVIKRLESIRHKNI